MKQANGNGTTNGAGAGNRQKEVELVGFKSKQVCSISDLSSHKTYLQSCSLPWRFFKNHAHQAGQGIRGLFVENLHLDEEVVGQPK